MSPDIPWEVSSRPQVRYLTEPWPVHCLGFPYLHAVSIDLPPRPILHPVPAWDDIVQQGSCYVGIRKTVPNHFNLFELTRNTQYI